MDFEQKLAIRTRQMGASAIREILKVVSQPGMISLAGGIPSPASFPMDVMRELTDRVLSEYDSSAFQYDLTEGFLPLRQALTEHLAAKGLVTSAQELLVSSGSQGGLDGLGKILIDKGDKIALEAPTYLGAIQAFNPYEPEYVRMDTDDDGLIPDSLEATLQGAEIKFVYLAPTFQNPTGRTIPIARRKQIAAIISRHNALLIEDDPYSELRYCGDPVPAIKTLAPDNVVYLGTLSKIFAPGLRLGYILAPEEIRRWLVLSKQGVDLHTSTFNQALAAEYLSRGHLKKHLPKILALYQPRREAMLEALDNYFPPVFRWSQPQGGMFVWVEGPDGFDMDALYREGLRNNVAFVPGKYFYSAAGEGLETMRLNFTMAEEATIERAVSTLGQIAGQLL